MAHMVLFFCIEISSIFRMDGAVFIIVTSYIVFIRINSDLALLGDLN